ncbi:3-phenylpropionate/trans-cinnamate dioxygenase ferredoxin reductase subunit [Leucobacter komagatae]|uniref:3-phenylpropionate/trans-cinnamate dioxygenase ferredoxin reductase subunit n=1 Tax=Leucobacter komagatae TaxID=55969 RepID=A0A542Y4B6_9MICO|nr:NAD(P)/FAD-dependent oxidoreductase [Leucobacter komagatae]TQL42916.1 3-phenylpropionate/trans-cinnamate dioxygenase ferredoxin reductase subunit [Leucobacter komagatae]
MSSEPRRIVVVGASTAGEAFVGRLRELGHEGEIVVVDRDARMPYDRPPLSKGYLTDPDDTDIGVEWGAGTTITVGEATGLDTAARMLTYVEPNGAVRELTYDTLVIASGATPMRLPIEQPGVCHFRSAEDADRLRAAAGAGTRVGIIGAGAIGAELATSLSSNGAAVVLLDKADRPLERLLVGYLGADVTSWLQSTGVDCRWGVDIERIAGAPGDWRVELGDGSQLPFDVLVSAVGVSPTVAWLAESGLLTAGQLRCDDTGRVITDNGPHPDVFAVGDVVTRVLSTGDVLRTESWSAAKEHGAQLAEHLTGAPITSAELPYFWTDVAGRKIQVLGTVRRQGKIEIEFESTSRGGVVYRVDGDDGSTGWIGVNAPARIAALRMSAQPVLEGTGND